MSFFSVIVPLYNKAPYIRRCVNSVLAQTFKDFELIVVDDGSTDEGGELVASYADPRIRLIRQENAGEGAARNRGMLEAKTNWLAFLDADDEYLPKFLEKMHEAIVNHPEIEFVFSNLVYLSTSGILPNMIKGKNKLFQVIDNYFDFLYEHGLGGAISSAVVIRKSILQQAGGFPVGVTFGGDTDTWLRLGCVANKAGYEPSSLAVYHNEVMATFWVHSAGSPPKRRYPVYPAQLISTYHNWKQKGMFPEQKEKAWLRCMRGYLLLHVYDLVQYGDKKAAWRLFLKELKWDGWWQQTAKIFFMLLFPRAVMDILRNIKHQLIRRRQSLNLKHSGLPLL